MSILNEDFFDDERYLVHIEKSYSRSGAVNTLPLSLNRQNAEIIKIYISYEIDNQFFRI